MKPLTKDQERGMLKQSPAGDLASFLYDNDVVLQAMRHINRVRKSSTEEISLRKFAKLDKRILDRLETIDSACQNTSVTGVFRKLMHLHGNGIKAITPSASFTDAMALTEANYLTDDFRMPYPTIVVEIPEGCRGHIRIMRDSLPAEADKLYGDLWGIDMEKMYSVGAEARYIILSEVELRKEQTFEEFGGNGAARCIEIEVMTSEFLRGEITKPYPISDIFGGMLKKKFPMVFNPAPVSFYSRPLVKGRTVDEIITYRAHNRDESPGTIILADDDVPLDPNTHYTEGSEMEYMIRISRMAMNVIFALTNMGFDEEKKASAPKLKKRGSDKAKRVIPDVLKTTTVLDAEISKVKYDDSEGYSGVVVSPHFRRGHWRRQRHGEGRSQIKNVWIAPIVVNKHLLRKDAEENVVHNSKAS